MADQISFTAGMFLLIVSLLVMKTYAPRRDWTRTPKGVLGMAIFLGFAAAAVNTLWWQILGNTLPDLGIVSRENFRVAGLWLDGLFKGLAAVSAILHLVAIRMQLDEPDRSNYSWFEMPWYPKRRTCLQQLSRILNRRGQ